MNKTYITLEEALALGYTLMCPDESERCEELADIKDFEEDYNEAELMEKDPDTLILDGREIIRNECESQEIWDMGEGINEADIEEFHKACEKFNKAVHNATRSYRGTNLYILLNKKTASL